MTDFRFIDLVGSRSRCAGAGRERETAQFQASTKVIWNAGSSEDGEMQVEHHRWLSPSLNREMDVIVYGTSGRPVLVFPSQNGRAQDFEGFGMVNACAHFIERGQIRLFCVDSVDGESWANRDLPPWERGVRHEHYDRYITTEVCPFIGTSQGLPLTTGCSMGGYHSANFFFRHPDLFSGVICLSGLFQLGMFIDGYCDSNAYFNSPLLFLPGLEDRYYLDAYERSDIIICVGQGAWEAEMIADARALEEVLKLKGIKHWVDYWGTDVAHDWPWWQKQLPYFLGRLLEER